MGQPVGGSRDPGMQLVSRICQQEEEHQETSADKAVRDGKNRQIKRLNSNYRQLVETEMQI